MIKTNQWTHIILLILLCLCLMLPAGAALAEEVADLGTDGYDSLTYADTLSDGRILLCGERQVSGEGFVCSAKLLCLNPDRTVSWEYTDPAGDDGNFSFAAELPDGTIGTVYTRHSDEKGGIYELRFFTPDGEPTGKIISILEDENIYVSNVTKTRLLVMENSIWGDLRNWLLDWDGNEIAEFDGRIYSSGMIEEEDGLVLTVHNIPTDSGDYDAAIRKTDLQGNTVWETVMPQMWPGSDNTQIISLSETEDGGYLAVQDEMTYSSIGIREYRTALVKLDADGKILWTSTDGLENVVDLCETAAVTDGKIVLYFLAHREEGPVSFRLVNPRTVYMFDENGKNTGKAELSLNPESFERLDAFIQKYSDEEQKLVHVLLADRVIFMQDGPWLSARVLAMERKSTGNIGISFDTVLIKLPQP